LETTEAAALPRAVTILIPIPASVRLPERYGEERSQRSPTHRAWQQPRNEEFTMKPLLALVTLTLTALIFEEKARQIASDAQDAFDQTVVQVREAKQSLTQKVEQQPLISVLFAGGLAYLLAKIVPVRE
jgi:hypothetical protein